MFVGYQGDLPAFLKATREELENLPCVTLDRIEEVEFAEMYEGKIYLVQEELVAAKQSTVRAVRNKYLVEYVDPVASNPLRWADLTEEEQEDIKNYRLYLLDYTKQANWWVRTPKTFAEWKEWQDRVAEYEAQRLADEEDQTEENNSEEPENSGNE